MANSEADVALTELIDGGAGSRTLTNLISMVYPKGGPSMAKSRKTRLNTGANNNSEVLISAAFRFLHSSMQSNIM